MKYLFLLLLSINSYAQTINCQSSCPLSAPGIPFNCQAVCVIPTPSPTPQPTPSPTPSPSPVPTSTPNPYVSIPFTTGEWSDDFGMANTPGATVSLTTTSTTFQPPASRSTNQGSTSAVMLSTKRYAVNGVIDFDLKLSANTLSQLRTNSPPNAWEVFWLFFNKHKGSDNNPAMNYIAFKPNGIEVGLAFSIIGQTFLITSNAASFPIGVAYNVEVIKEGLNLKIYKNGILSISANVANLYNVPGTLSLYCEDARVLVSQFDIKVLK